MRALFKGPMRLANNLAAVRNNFSQVSPVDHSAAAFGTRCNAYSALAIRWSSKLPITAFHWVITAFGAMAPCAFRPAHTARLTNSR